MPLVEPTSFAEEERLRIPTQGVDTVVVSGYANVFPKIQGDPDDDQNDVAHTVHMEIGPEWLGVRDVSPIVARAGYGHTDPDEADYAGYEIKSCTWDTVGSPPPNTNHERIRLIVEIDIRGGGESWMRQLAYHLTAVGVLAPGAEV